MGVRRSFVVAGLLAVMAAGALCSVGGTAVVGAAIDDAPARAGASWLAAELDAGGGRLEHIGQTDWGLTADAILAVTAGLGRGNTSAGAAAGALWENRDSFMTWDDLGADLAGVLLAGPTAKVLLVAQAVDRPEADRAALETQLRSLIVTSGPNAGRVADRNPHDVDSSSTFTHALAVAALSRTDGGVPGPVVDFLLAQQCPAGGFRLTPAEGACTDDATIDTDATSLALQALLVVDRTAEVGAALSRVVGWLGSAQATSGSFSGTGPTAIPNTNSTGLAAQALRAAGQATAADRAGVWIASLQRGAGGTDEGAIAYDPTAAAAATGGIGPLARDQWRRATAQALYAFGAPVIGRIGDMSDPPPPVTPSTVPTSTSTTTIPTTSSSTSTSSTTTSTAVSAATTTVADGAPTTTVSKAPSVDVESSTVSRSSGASDPGLARTGVDLRSPLGLAMVAIGLGGLVLLYVPRREAKRP